MNVPRKATVDEIRARFDADVERFSNLETGQAAAIDSPLMMELLTQAAAAATPGATRLLDVGCGAGNQSIKLLQRIPGLEVTLLDLSLPMLERAQQRVRAAGASAVHLLQSDIRETDFPDASFDVILAASVLHHLRNDAEWETTFAKFHRILAPGGSLWISDLIDHGIPAVHDLMWSRYGDFLCNLQGPDYREKVYAYVEAEDTPRPVTYQLDLLRRVGFAHTEILHKNSVFAAFGGVK